MISFKNYPNHPFVTGIVGDDIRVTLKRGGLPVFLKCRITGEKWALDEGFRVLEIQEAILLSGSVTPTLVGWNVYSILTCDENAELLKQIREQVNTAWIEHTKRAAAPVVVDLFCGQGGVTLNVPAAEGPGA